MKKLPSKWFGINRKAANSSLEQIRRGFRKELDDLQKNIADCLMENERLSQEKEELKKQVEGMYSQRLLELANKRVKEIQVFMENKASADVDAIRANLRRNLLTYKNQEVEINNEILMTREKTRHELERVSLIMKDQKLNQEATLGMDWESCLGKKVMTPGKALIGKITGIAQNNETGIVEGFQIATGLSPKTNFLAVQQVLVYRHSDIIVSSDWARSVSMGDSSESFAFGKLTPRQTIRTGLIRASEYKDSDEVPKTETQEKSITADGTGILILNSQQPEVDQVYSNVSVAQGYTPFTFGGGFWGFDKEIDYFSSEKLIAATMDLEINEDMESNTILKQAEREINEIHAGIIDSMEKETDKNEKETTNDKEKSKIEVKNSLEDRITNDDSSTSMIDTAPFQGDVQQIDLEGKQQAENPSDVRVDIEHVRSKYIVGKLAGADLYDNSGELIIKRGETITASVMRRTQSEGKLAELIVHMIIPGLDE